MIPRRIRTLAVARRQAKRMSELSRVVCDELKEHGSAGVVTDVSGGYDNRAMAWEVSDERRPVIGFRIDTPG